MMINWDFILLVVFFLFLYTFFRLHRDKFEVQAKIFALYKTKLGLGFMDSIASKFPRFLKFISNISIGIGFVGMIVTLVFLIKGAISFFGPAAVPQIAPVLPGISIGNLPKLSFWHWIISILIAATVHEFMHGVYSRVNKVKIKSSGFAFLGPILAAFVEPDEKQLEKKSTRAQLSVLSAGPFANIVLGVFILIFMIFVINPVSSNLIQVNGFEVVSLNESFPIAKSGIRVGSLITEINGIKLDSSKSFDDILDEKKPGDFVSITSDDKKYEVKLGEHHSEKGRGVLGLSSLKLDTQPVKEGLFFKILVKVFAWFALLLFWLLQINIGIGLFNLLPLGPVDGGRMFFVSAYHFTKNKTKALKILNYVSIFILFLILINLWPWITKLFSFVFGPIVALF